MSYKVSDNVARRTNKPAQTPVNPVEYEKAIYQRGLHFERPKFTFQTEKWQSLAEERLSADAKGYLVGNAGTGETARKNVEAFAKWSIMPKRLVKTGGLPDLSTNVLGTKFPFPIAMAPIGVQKIFNPDGEIASAAAAEKECVPYILSTASSTSIEDVARANGKGVRWYQLYWPLNEHNDITRSILSRAKTSGYSALVVTLDTYILGWRPSDMDNGLEFYMIQWIGYSTNRITGTTRFLNLIALVWQSVSRIQPSEDILKRNTGLKLRITCTRRLRSGLP